MFRFVVMSAVASVAIAPAAFAASAVGASVESYVAGSVPSFYTPYQDTSRVLGTPALTNDYGAINAFNGPFSNTALTYVGPGGSIDIRLSASVATGAAGALGVFGNGALIDFDPDSDFDIDFNYIAGGRGIASSPAQSFGGSVAKISVSDDGLTWYALNGGSSISLLNPTNAYTDNDVNLGTGSIGTQVSDFSKPFYGSISSFDGLRYRDALAASDVLRVLDGSGGGTWVPLTGLPIPTVNYVRFEVGAGERLVLDAISAVPEPGAVGVLAGAVALLAHRRRRA